MIIKVLGAAAGGGLPQWNCNGENSSAARAANPALSPQTQSSLAVSADGNRWLLLNASPDIRQQIASTPQLHPAPDGAPRNSPVAAVLLTNGDVDHVAGLLSLREGHAFRLYASGRVLQTLADNTIFNVLNEKLVERIAVTFDAPFAVTGTMGPLDLTAEVFTVPGKVALYMEDATAGANFGTRDGDTLGVRISARDGGASFYYIPGCAALDARLRARLAGAPLVFFDGTLYADDEMITQGLSQKTGARMGHMNMSGADGSLAAFKGLGVGRKVYIHLNNSNPVLHEGSPERALVAQAGWEIAYDGMELRP